MKLSREIFRIRLIATSTSFSGVLMFGIILTLIDGEGKVSNQHTSTCKMSQI